MNNIRWVKRNVDIVGKPAVIVVDMQKFFCDPEGIIGKRGADLSHIQEVKSTINAFIYLLRRFGNGAIPIIFTKQVETDEVIPQNLKLQLGRNKIPRICDPSEQDLVIAPLEGEYVLEKHTYDPFSNLKLRRILDEQRISTLIFTGVNTDLCIDTGVRSAFTQNFHVVIGSDLTATNRPELHEVFLERLDSYFGQVVTSFQLIETLRLHYFLSEMPD